MIDDYKRNGPGQGQVADARSALSRDLEANLASNGYLLNRILFKYEFGEDVREVFNMRPFYDQVTVAGAARRGGGVPEHEPLRGGHAGSGETLTR